MKLLTINTHSYIEKDYLKKRDIFCDCIEKIRPDIISMQEVNQTILSQNFKRPLDEEIILCGDIPLKEDNHALYVLNKLKERDLSYNLIWLGIKKGYDKYDEGLAILSLNPIEEYKHFYLTDIKDYNNWKTRMALGIKVSGQWFYNVHFGWWNDENEPFILQWERFSSKIDKDESVWVMGDFNNPSDKKGEGYDHITSKGWFDTYNLAKIKDEGYTVNKEIDGWKNQEYSKLRIDYIFTNKKEKIKSSSVIFDGKNEEQISDHFGVIVNL